MASIPEAAVEAAAREFASILARSKWDDIGPMTQEACREHARAALEAAAPQMLADAWDEGCAEGFERGSDEYRLEGDQPNPYRPTP